MHRVELKVNVMFKKVNQITNVPNAPCGVERINFLLGINHGYYRS